MNPTLVIAEKKRKVFGHLRKAAAGRCFVLTDTNTSRVCMPLLQPFLPAGTLEICIPSGEHHKNMEQVQQVWTRLLEAGAGRDALLLNLGGGMITDLGGFAAATYKRGIDFIHIPTTLMGMCDAAIGGKTGVDFHSGKNQVGLFVQPKEILIYPGFLDSLPAEECLSGLAEYIKMAMLDGQFRSVLRLHRKYQQTINYTALIRKAVRFKRRLVQQDPEERGRRALLNFGHTIGHAMESASLAKGNAVPHGFCVAAGLLAEIRLSVLCLQFPEKLASPLMEVIYLLYRGHFPKVEMPECLPWLGWDKKNKNGKPQFVLLNAKGKPEFGVTVPPELVKQVVSEICKLII